MVSLTREYVLSNIGLWLRWRTSWRGLMPSVESDYQCHGGSDSHNQSELRYPVRSVESRPVLNSRYRQRLTRYLQLDHY